MPLIRMFPRFSRRTGLYTVATIAISLALASYSKGGTPDTVDGDYPAYHGGPAGDNYSVLTQITKANVGQLAEAWRLETGVGNLQTSPIVISGILYAITPGHDVIALDGATGALLWKHPLADAGGQPVRGLNWWQRGEERRLLVGAGPFLTALDPKTGTPIKTFGDNGQVDLRVGLGQEGKTMPLAMTAPGIIYNDLIIVGFRTAESKPAAPGAIRAYDVHSGALRWTFHLLPRPGQPGAETWAAGSLEGAGGANNWAGMALDADRGIVYVPTGSAVDDFYGAARKGQNLYANSLVALDASSGQRLWHYQVVHHDLWDRDLPSPPVLLTVQRNGKPVDAVAQATKHGFLFLFDRLTGKPLFPVEERPVPRSDTPGEQAWPTQPFPTAPAPFARQLLTADMLTDRTPEARTVAAAAFAKMRSEGQFVPFSTQRQTVVFPGFDGGAEWGGQAVDRRRGVIFVNANDVPWTGELAAKANADDPNSGAALYQNNCAGCHGLNRKGSPPAFPTLVDVMARKLDGDVARTIMAGRGRMPAFNQFDQRQLMALMAYLREPVAEDRREMAPAPGAHDFGKSGSGYLMTGYVKFVDRDGYPAVKPPWGTLNAIDLNSGRYLWRIPLGHYPKLAAAGIADTGTENYGGPVLTASGVLFIGATIYDRQFRAFDADNGRLLWSATLPYAGVATPITYTAKERQFVVIATSSDRDPSARQGSAYVAFALPRKAS